MTAPGHICSTSCFTILRNPRLSGWTVAFLLLVSCLFLLDRTVHREYVMDEVTYHYKIQSPGVQWIETKRGEVGENGVKAYINERVESFQDVVESQYNHYMLWHGRTLIHFIIQLGAVYGNGLIIALNLLFFCGLVVGLIRLSLSSSSRSNPLIWLLLVMGLLYLSPDGSDLWTSINVTPNYIWPGCLTVWFLVFFNDLRSGKSHSRWSMAIVAFLLGLSHEGFSASVSGATLLYFLFRPRRLRGELLWLVVPLWIGTVFVLASPGLYTRVGGTAWRQLRSSIIWCTVYMVRQIWVLLFIVVGCWKVIRERRRLRALVSRNFIYICILVFGAVFATVGRSLQRSFFISDLMCVVMLLKAADGFLAGSEAYKRLQWTLFLLLGIAFGLHQIQLCSENRRVYASVRSMVERMKESPDGVFMLPEVDIAPLSSNYIPTPSAMYGVYPGSPYSSIQALNGCLDKPFYPIHPRYTAPVFSPEEFFVPANRIPGDAPVYYTERAGHWVHPDSVRTIGHYTLYLEPYPWNYLPPELAHIARKVVLAYETRPLVTIGKIQTPRGTGFYLSTLYGHRITDSRLRIER